MPESSPTVSSAWHLAQVNIARMLAPLDSPLMAGFVARLNELNALADRSPGFVWRLKENTGNATYLRPYDDECMLFNLSVWDSLEPLKTYVYHTAHIDMIRQRQQWFESSDEPVLALWWIPAGHIPSIDEAKERLAHLRRHGATARAFGFRTPFPPPV